MKKFETRFRVNPKLDKEELPLIMWAKSGFDWMCTLFVVKPSNEKELLFVMEPIQLVDGQEAFTGLTAYVITKEELEKFFVEKEENQECVL